ncbi:putative glycosyltransferase EpsJ [bacterium BMS3Abin01]|nr:putative glycosyltransferase EpsJ [bacterium BMS3Abin01]
MSASNQQADLAATGPSPEAARPAVSVVIPVYNSAGYLETVLAAVYQSSFRDFEVVIVNDCSTDNSLQVLSGLSDRFPYRLVDFQENLGVSKARNAGADAARGDIILFIDADCVVQPHTMARCVAAMEQEDRICVGGAYTTEPWDKGFFNTFQSIYINHVETKVENPDYIATHCMAIRKDTFRKFGGFITDSFIGHAASVEDVELSHRMLAAGYRLSRPQDILVQHIFGYNFRKSVKNAVKKSKYWTMYSLKNRDVMKDSGAASYELKTNVGTQALNLGLLVALLLTGKWWLLLPMAALFLANLAVSFRLLLLIKREQGWWFLARAMAYFMLVYPIVVAYGSGVGTLKYIWEVKLLKRYS